MPALRRRRVEQGALLIAIGLAVGWSLVRLGDTALARVLFGVTPGDAASTAIAAGLLLAASILACVPPAVRPATVDPVEGLRVE